MLRSPNSFKSRSRSTSISVLPFFIVCASLSFKSLSPVLGNGSKHCFRTRDIDNIIGACSPHVDLYNVRCRSRCSSNRKDHILCDRDFTVASKSNKNCQYDFLEDKPLIFESVREWMQTIEQPYLLFFPIDLNPKNEVQIVKRTVFSSTFPSSFKTKTVLAAASESALVDCLDFDLAFVTSPLFHNLISGSYNSELRTFLPKSLTHRYGGHQFGYWAGQLGDGRAHLLGTRINRKHERWELQLKGSGQTPYSRQGDGRAVLRSSIREFLASEAMYYLGIPTSRAATLVVSDDLFARDQFYDGNVIYERGAVVMRLAPSWFRFGSLEILSKSNEFDLLKILVDFVINHHFLHIEPSNPDKYLMLYDEIVRATAHMIAQWQSVGFTHGVCNTDNFSLLSITIDYGPFGFMDKFDPKYVPNTSDDEARYSFENQAKVGFFNLDKLKLAFWPLWNLSQRQTAEIILQGFNNHFKSKYVSLFSKKLGFHLFLEDADEKLIKLFLQIMHESKSDFTLTFRHLGENSLENLINRNINKDSWTIKLIEKHELYDTFLKRYAERLERDNTSDRQRMISMTKNNPRYILRNWMAERAINLAEKNDFSGIKLLYRVLKNPFLKQEEAEKHKFADKPPSWASHIRISCSS